MSTKHEYANDRKKRVGPKPEGSDASLPPVRKVSLYASADWHWCETPPKARKGHGSGWLEAQIEYLHQIKTILRHPNGYQDYPLVVAGDIFNSFDQSPKSINTLIESMPHVFAVAGNHELPNHRLDRIRNSAFWTLIEAGKITLLKPNQPKELFTQRLWGFSWGQEPVPLEKPHDLLQEICVCHKYMFVKGTGYPGAPEEARVASCYQQFKGFDVVVSGDNHIPHNVTKNGTRFLNCGNLYRKTSDQEDYQPAIWRIFDDNTVEAVYLDISKDVFERTKKEEPIEVNNKKIHDFVSSMKHVKDEVIDFDEAVKRQLRRKDLSEEVKEVLIQLLEDKT